MIFPVVLHRYESLTIKKAERQRTDVFELWCWRRLLSPLKNKIKRVNPNCYQYWVFFGRTDAEAEVPILWPPDVNSQLIGKDPDAGKDWRWEKETTENEMVGWHRWRDGHEFEKTLGDSEGQGSLAGCSLWVAKSWTQLSNWTTVFASLNLKLLTLSTPSDGHLPLVPRDFLQ